MHLSTEYFFPDFSHVVTLYYTGADTTIEKELANVTSTLRRHEKREDTF